MLCTLCASSNLREFPAEVNIHFPGLKNADKPGVFVFPKLLVCLHCGSSFVHDTNVRSGAACRNIYKNRN